MARVRPQQIRLEASSHCQLRCPACPTTTKDIQPVVGSGFLTLSHFKHLVDTSPWLKAIELSNYGEIFLNPELLDMMKYAHARGVALAAENGVNLNFVKPDVLEGLVKYNVRRLTCSIDGATPDTYARYRVRGRLDVVLDNIRSINRFKQAYGATTPEMTWQFVAFGHNEHEIPAARALADELGMQFVVKLSWDPEFSPIQDQEALRALVGASSRAEFKTRHGVEYMQSICHQLWDLPQINWDGKVLGCCRNFWGDFGPDNAFRDGLLRSINSEKMVYARDMLRGRRPAREDIPCTTCQIYVGMKRENRWLQRQEPSLPQRAWRFLRRVSGLGA